MKLRTQVAGGQSNPLRRYYHGSEVGMSRTGTAGNSGSLPTSLKAPFALVTGSTGGIGEEWIYQLVELGFNVIAQGRNADKLETLKSTILARAPEADVRLLCTEATIYPNLALTERLTHLLDDPEVRLTIVINNLGTVSTGFPLLEQETSETIGQVLLSNTFFPAEVSRITLPHLKKHQPSLLSVVTSLGAWNPPPFLSPYVGTKGFDVAFSRSLRNEMAVQKEQVDVVCLAPGQVVSNMHPYPATLMAPTSAEWTRSAIEALGPTPWWYAWWSPSAWWSGRPSGLIVPYLWHRWGQRATLFMPTWVSDMAATNIVLDLRANYRKAQTDRLDREHVEKKLL
ncbi:unnamed protein product [Parajaminaea phylloscopi]